MRSELWENAGKFAVDMVERSTLKKNKLLTKNSPVHTPTPKVGTSWVLNESRMVPDRILGAAGGTHLDVVARV